MFLIFCLYSDYGWCLMLDCMLDAVGNPNCRTHHPEIVPVPFSYTFACMPLCKQKTPPPFHFTLSYTQQICPWKNMVDGLSFTLFWWVGGCRTFLFSGKNLVFLSRELVIWQKTTTTKKINQPQPEAHNQPSTPPARFSHVFVLRTHWNHDLYKWWGSIHSMDGHLK